MTSTDTHKIGRYLLERTIDRGRGREKPYAVGDDPADLFYISNLSPEAGRGERDELDAKTRPSTIGLRCRPTDDRGELRVEFDIYVPSVPTYNEYTAIQQRRIRSAQIRAVDQTEDADIWEDVSIDDIDHTYLYKLDEKFYRRITIQYDTKVTTTDPRGESERVSNELDAEIRETVETFAEDHVLSTEKIGTYLESTALFVDLSEDTFEEGRESVPTVSSSELEWNVEFVVDNTDQNEITFTLENQKPARDPKDIPGEQFVFNPKIEYSANLSPYTFELIPEDYRYDQKIWAKGQNCSTTVESDAEPMTVRTTAIPTSPVYEFVFNSDYETDFDQLSRGNTIETLEQIAEGMREYHEEWTGRRREEVQEQLELDEAELEEYDRAADRFGAELERYEHGVDIVRLEDDVLRAFRLMNEVNARQHDFPGWRLFQLVFIVSNLSGVVCREYPQHETTYDQKADVLWFPTGGGKTEAYVGLILFNLFFDRLRGKSQGVTAWIRFPLRLLGRQQKTRFLESLLYAEEIRQSSNDFASDSRGEPFSLGFFAGGYDTPNAIGTKRDTLREMFQKDQKKLENKCQVVDECPLCGSEVDVEYDVEKNSVFHNCQGDDCLGQLPIYVVDRDIYRYVPSILLGSLDKIAVFGMQPRFANLLGNYTTWCPVHGYGYSGRCSEHQLCDRDDDLEDVDPDDIYDPIPTLHLIDEVHLLSEELGTFASHYETLYETLCKQIGDETPKVIASTATIAEYERQIENLFQKDATRFPADGPVQGETFYGELTETVEREYLGIRPSNRSHLYTILDTIIDYHQLIRDAYQMDPKDLGSAAGVEELMAERRDEIIDMYETSLIYFNAKDRKDRYRENITKYANDQMVNSGYDSPIIERQLTADTESPELLNELEDPGETPFRERIDTVPATSFIGHGIDVDRFNLMLFYGFPRQTFQYIQASSRVGRQSGVVGFVLDVFDPLKKRDSHRYRYFEKVHQYLDRTVEPVPIDRWAKFGIDRTFSGILKACLLQYFRPLMYRKYEIAIDEDDDPEPANVQKTSHLYEIITTDEEYTELNRSELKQLVGSAYGLDNGRYTNPYFRSEVERRTSRVWNYWAKKLPEMDFPEFPDGEEPMISLRDIGDQGTITVEYKNQPFMKHLTVGGD